MLRSSAAAQALCNNCSLAPAKLHCSADAARLCVACDQLVRALGASGRHNVAPKRPPHTALFGQWPGRRRGRHGARGYAPPRRDRPCSPASRVRGPAAGPVVGPLGRSAAHTGCL